MAEPFIRPTNSTEQTYRPDKDGGKAISRTGRVRSYHRQSYSAAVAVIVGIYVCRSSSLEQFNPIRTNGC